MALLPEAERYYLWAETMRELSRHGIEIPVAKDALRTLVDRIDEGLETTEATIFAGLPGGPGKTWLLAHQNIGREIIAHIMQCREETL